VLGAGLVNVTRRASDGAVLVSRVTGSSPRAVLAAVAGGLRSLASGSRSAAHSATPKTEATRMTAGWTAPAPGDTDSAAVAARVAAALHLRAASIEAVAAELEARAAAPRVAALEEAARASASSPWGALPPPAPADFAAAGTVPLEYAGAALAVGDFNADGASDLVATAYGASPVGTYVDDALGVAPSPPIAGAVLPQAGGWYLRTGAPAGAATAAAAADGPEPLSPADRSTGASVYARLGEAACVLDFNGDGVMPRRCRRPGSRGAHGWLGVRR